jgi:hypothetical protein
MARSSGFRSAERLLYATTFALFGAGLFIYVCIIQYHYPLLDWAFVDFNWMKEWLLTSLFDRLGFSLCFSFIIYINESSAVAVLFILGILIFGSSGGCVYVAYR